MGISFCFGYNEICIPNSIAEIQFERAVISLKKQWYVMFAQKFIIAFEECYHTPLGLNVFDNVRWRLMMFDIVKLWFLYTTHKQQQNIIESLILCIVALKLFLWIVKYIIIHLKKSSQEYINLWKMWLKLTHSQHMEKAFCIAWWLVDANFQRWEENS